MPCTPLKGALSGAMNGSCMMQSVAIFPVVLSHLQWTAAQLGSALERVPYCMFITYTGATLGLIPLGFARVLRFAVLVGSVSIAFQYKSYVNPRHGRNVSISRMDASCCTASRASTAHLSMCVSYSSHLSIR